MNTFDIILIGLLAIGAVRGFKKGIILEIAGLLGLFLAFFGTLQLVDWGAGILAGYNKDISESILPIVAFIILFVLILIGVYLSGKIIKAAFHITPFGILDNIIGGVVGVLKWSLGISLVFWILGFLEIEVGADSMKDSLVLPYILLLTPFFMDLIVAIIPYFQELLSSIEALFKNSQP